MAVSARSPDVSDSLLTWCAGWHFVGVRENFSHFVCDYHGAAPA